MEKNQGNDMFRISPTNSSAGSFEGPNGVVRNVVTGKNTRYYRPFKSSRVPDDFVIPIRPRSKTAIFARRMPWIATAIGCLMVVACGYWGYANVPKHKFTTVTWYEDFSSPGYDFLQDFNRDVSFSGFGKDSRAIWRRLIHTGH